MTENDGDSDEEEFDVDDDEPKGDEGKGAAGDAGKGDDAPKTDVREPLSGEDFFRMYDESPDLQDAVRTKFADMLTESRDAAVRQERTAEFNKLIEEGNYEELGKRFVDSHKRAQLESEVRERVREAEYGAIYGKLMNQPEMKSLTDDEKKRLDPAKFDNDADYVVAMSELISEKRLAGTLETKIASRMESERNKASAGKAASQAVGGTPAATSNSRPLDTMSDRDLIKMGFEKLLNPEE